MRPVAHPLLRGLAKPRPPLTAPLLGGPLGASLGASLPSLRGPSLGHRSLAPGLPKTNVNASTAALLAGMAGMDETANAELDGIREALLQAEATEQYLAARQEEIANALLAVAGASTAMPSIESLLLANDQDTLTKALLQAAGGGATAPGLGGLGGGAAGLGGLGDPGGELDDVTKALLSAASGSGNTTEALLAALASANGSGNISEAVLGAGGASSNSGVEALLAAAASGGGAAAEALLAAAAGGGSTTEALLAAAGGTGSSTSAGSSATGGSGAGGGSAAAPSGNKDDGLDEMTKALLAAAGVDANTAGSDDVTQALLAAAVGNTAAVTAAADGKEDEITKALLAAAASNPKNASSGGGASGGGGAAATAPAASPAPPAPEKKPEKPLPPEPAPPLPTPEAAATANVPEEMTKALLAAVATNTPSAAGDADRIIKAVLRAATASMSDPNEPPPFAALTEDPKQKTPMPEQQPVAKPAPPAWEDKKKEPPEKPKEKPHGSMVSTEFLRAMEENAKASARTSAARTQAARPAPISFSIGPAAKKQKTDKLLDDDEQDELNKQLLEAEGTKSWIFFGKIPKGTSEGLIRTECAKYGTVTSILYNAEPDSLFEEPWALVSLSSLESAAKAVDRLNSRLTLFGGTQQVEVRMGTPEDLAKWEELVKAEEQIKPQVPALPQVPVQETQLVLADGAPPGGRSKRHDGSRRGARDPYSVDSRGSDGRGRRRRRHDSRSYSRSPSDYRDPPPLPITERKVYGLGGFDNASVDADKKTPRATAAEAAATASLVMAPSGDRRIGTRGSWAEFVTREWEYYYVNIHTGEKRWMLPVAEMRGVAPRRSS